IDFAYTDKDPALGSVATRLAGIRLHPFAVARHQFAVWRGHGLAGREIRSAVDPGTRRSHLWSGQGPALPPVAGSLSVQHGGDVGDWRRVTDQKLLAFTTSRSRLYIKQCIVRARDPDTGLSSAAQNERLLQSIDRTHLCFTGRRRGGYCLRPSARGQHGG